MNFNQRNLGREFLFGETSGRASNVEIKHFPNVGLTALIGYGHAVYATREIGTGTVVYYEGWYGRSASTSCQLTKMGLSKNSPDHDLNVDETIDERKSLKDLRMEERKAGSPLVEEASAP
jgi:hypothetical protein